MYLCMSGPNQHKTHSVTRLPFNRPHPLYRTLILPVSHSFPAYVTKTLALGKLAFRQGPNDSTLHIVNVDTFSVKFNNRARRVRDPTRKYREPTKRSQHYNIYSRLVSSYFISYVCLQITISLLRKRLAEVVIITFTGRIYDVRIST